MNEKASVCGLIRLGNTWLVDKILVTWWNCSRIVVDCYMTLYQIKLIPPSGKQDWLFIVPDASNFFVGIGLFFLRIFEEEEKFVEPFFMFFFIL